MLIYGINAGHTLAFCNTWRSSYIEATKLSVVVFTPYIVIYFSVLLNALLSLHSQSLDKNCLGPLRKAYCSSLNLLLRREVWENNLLSTFFVVNHSFCLICMLHFLLGWLLMYKQFLDLVRSLDLTMILERSRMK